MAGRTRGREKNITGAGKPVYKRGQGLGTGPVGSAGGYSGRGGSGRSGGPGRGSGGKRGKGGILALLALLLLGGGGAGVGGLFGGSEESYSTSSDYSAYYSTPAPTAYVKPTPTPASQSSYEDIYSQLFGGQGDSYGSSSYSGYSNSFDSLYSASSSSGWDYGSNTGRLDTSVHPDARDKYTDVDNADTVTVMIYMCGTDLESQSGMATSDLQEMTNAAIGSNVNVIVYTGGCTRWRNGIVSASTNQIYKVESGGLKRLDSDAGSVSMTKPSTLASFIKFCDRNFPADRSMLILWDHGGGAISGFGYDQKFASSGSMGLSGINEALRSGGVKFDIIGFDACLMATAENAVMLANHADYLLASEETEPGTGWYYTNWLTELSRDVSMPSVELGKHIIDDFVDVCAQQTRGQKTTLSIVDLAELEVTMPERLSDFAESTCDLIEGNGYKTVSAARSSAREYSTSSRIDHVDLVHLARNMGTDEGKALAEVILDAVKYNRTSSSMTNSHGLSIYFPYRKASAVSKAVAAYEAIGMDEDYTRCIQAFAGYESAGQAVSGGSSAASPYGSLYDWYNSGSSYSGGSSSYDPYGSYGSSGYGEYSYEDVYGMLEEIFGMMGSYGYSYSGGRSASVDERALSGAAEYVSANRFDATALYWTRGGDGQYRISLPEEQWGYVNQLELNVFYDDGEGFIDLGLDNVFEFDDNGALLGSYDGTWLAIDSQPVAYYHVSTVDDGENYSITGRVPVMLNGQRADLILVFDNENPYGYVAGARYDYRDGETETIAKGLTGLSDGDEIDFLCDYYSYDGDYLDSYMLGDPYVVDGEMEISNVYLPDESAALPCYRLTDIYHQQYWTPVLPTA